VITTYGNGLFRYTIADGKLTHFAYDKNIRGISSNYLLSIALDRNDNIWVGTESMGINKLSFANRDVQMIYPDITHKQKTEMWFVRCSKITREISGWEPNQVACIVTMPICRNGQ
jgi:ligand-binding sensor domain-containing protein